VSGLITVAGGKYTTYRLMARDAIDLAARGLERRVPESCSDRMPLVGAEGYAAVWNRRGTLAEGLGLHVGQVEHLLERYGARVQELIALMGARPELALPLEGAPTYLAAEAYYAASHEGALHLEDVLTRRTRISIETFDRGVKAARPVADLMAEVLHWDAATRERELAHYDARVEAERESQQQPDDRTADAARLGAPDVRLGSQGQGAVLRLPQKRSGA
jgi:glycerol-3-phosphate dehydrogenase